MPYGCSKCTLLHPFVSVFLYHLLLKKKKEVTLTLELLVLKDESIKLDQLLMNYCNVGGVGHGDAEVGLRDPLYPSEKRSIMYPICFVLFGLYYFATSLFNNLS